MNSKRNRRQVFAVLIFLLVVVAFAMTFRMGVVSGDSMLPTYHDKQILLVTRPRAWMSPLKRGDVVLMQTSHDIIIKRVVYLSGDTIEPRDAIQFFRVRDYFEVEKVPNTSQFDPPVRLHVPSGYIVVLGDNRDHSEDSRAFGPVPLSDVLGRVANAPPR